MGGKVDSRICAHISCTILKLAFTPLAKGLPLSDQN